MLSNCISSGSDVNHIRAWVDERIEVMRKLQLGWDGELAREITDISLNTAHNIAKAIIDNYGPRLIPHIFPKRTGGVRVEFNGGQFLTKGIWLGDIEIDAGTGAIDAAASNHETGAEMFLKCKAKDFSQIIIWLSLFLCEKL